MERLTKKSYSEKILFVCIVIFLCCLFTACPASVVLNPLVMPYSGMGVLSGAITVSDDPAAVVSKTAFPVISSAASYYYRIATDDGTNTKDYDLGTLTANAQGDYPFSVSIVLGTYTKITVAAFSDSAYTSKVLEGFKTTTTEVTEQNPFITFNVTLRPTTISTGTIDLTVYADSGTGINYVKYQDLSETNPFTQQSGDMAGFHTLHVDDVVSGPHKVSFSFYKKSDSPETYELLYQCTEVINVYDNMTTNSWVNNGNAEYLTDDGSGNTIFKLTQAILDNFALTNYYVDSTAEIDGNGSYFSPHKTISAAIDHALNATYPTNPDVTITIHVPDDFTETLDSSTGKTFVFGDNHKYVMECYENTPGDKKGSLLFKLDKDVNLFEIQGTLSLYGFKLQKTTGSSSVIKITSGGVLNMVDSAITQNVPGSGIEMQGYYDPPNSKYAQLNMYGSSYIYNCGGSGSGDEVYGIKAEVCSKINMKDTSNVSYCGLNGSGTSKGGIKIAGSSSRLDMNDYSHIEGCGSDSSNYGGIYVGSGAMAIISGNPDLSTYPFCGVYNNNGGGIYVDSGGICSLTNCKLTGNQRKGGNAPGNGAGVYSKGNLSLSQNVSIGENEILLDTTVLSIQSTYNGNEIDGVPAPVYVFPQANGGSTSPLDETKVYFTPVGSPLAISDYTTVFRVHNPTDNYLWGGKKYNFTSDGKVRKIFIIAAAMGLTSINNTDLNEIENGNLPAEFKIVEPEDGTGITANDIKTFCTSLNSLSTVKVTLDLSDSGITDMSATNIIQKNIEKVILPDNLEKLSSSGYSSLKPSNCIDSDVKEYVIAKSNQEFKTVDGILYQKVTSGGTPEHWGVACYPVKKTDTAYSFPDWCIDVYGIDVFAGCSNLTSIDAKSLKYIISGGALAGIPNLETIEFRDLTKTIHRTLASNPKLTTVTFPETLTKFSDTTFDGCSALTTIIFKNPTAPERVNPTATAFSTCTSLQYIYVPNADAVTAYKTIYQTGTAVTTTGFINKITVNPSP